jgi:hypothetical protein
MIEGYKRFVTQEPYEPSVRLGSRIARRRQRALALFALLAVIATVVWLILSNGGGPVRHRTLGASRLQPSASALAGSTRAANAPLRGVRVSDRRGATYG